MTLRAIVRAAAAEPAGALVLLHGRGADEHDLVPVGEALDPQRRFVLATPRAPFTVGWGAHWYHLIRLGVPEPLSFSQGRAALRQWLESFLQEQGIEPSKTILGGFSQGAAMSMTYALTAGGPQVAGVIACSGFLPEAPDLKHEPERVKDLPVFISHGLLDGVLPIWRGRQARDVFTAAGAKVAYREFAGVHQVDPGGLQAAKAWVDSVLP